MTATVPDTIAWPPIDIPAGHTVVLPAGERDRPAGVFVVAPTGVRYRPAVDVQRLASRAVAVTGLVTAAVAVCAVARAVRRPAAVGSVRMGPGGWVSVRNAGLPPLRSEPGRPWWARLLRAHRIPGR